MEFMEVRIFYLMEFCGLIFFFFYVAYSDSNSVFFFFFFFFFFLQTVVGVWGLGTSFSPQKMADGFMMDQDDHEDGENILLPFPNDKLRTSFGRGNEMVFCAHEASVGDGTIVCDIVSPALVCLQLSSFQKERSCIKTLTYSSLFFLSK